MSVLASMLGEKGIAAPQQMQSAPTMVLPVLETPPDPVLDGTPPAEPDDEQSYVAGMDEVLRELGGTPVQATQDPRDMVAEWLRASMPTDENASGASAPDARDALLEQMQEQLATATAWIQHLNERIGQQPPAPHAPQSYAPPAPTSDPLARYAAEDRAAIEGALAPLRQQVQQLAQQNAQLTQTMNMQQQQARMQAQLDKTLGAAKVGAEQAAGVGRLVRAMMASEGVDAQTALRTVQKLVPQVAFAGRKHQGAAPPPSLGLPSAGGGGFQAALAKLNGRKARNFDEAVQQSMRLAQQIDWLKR